KTGPAAAAGPRRRGLRHVLERDAAALGDAVDDPRRAREQPGAVVAAAELRRDHLPDGLAGEAVSDELLERVADLDVDAPVLHRDDDEEAVVLALDADPLAAVLEHLDGVFTDVAVRFE